MTTAPGRRAFLLLISSGAIAAIAMCSRVIQVGVFLAAAGFRRLHSRQDQSRPGPRASEWVRLNPPKKTPQEPASRVAITYHPWYQEFGVTQVAKCLEQAADLGAGYIRSDVRWSDVIPDGWTPDDNAFDWYRAYFTSARDLYGLRPLIVLGEPPQSFKRLPAATGLAAWNFYIESVMARLGDLCDVYQVFNETNNPVYRIFPEDQAAIALEAASETIRKHNPRSKIVVNMSVDLPNWNRTLTKLIAQNERAVDVIAIDYYPGTWSLRVGADWSPIVNLAKEATPDSGVRLAGRAFAIMETGYATNMRGFRTEAQQKAYFDNLEQVTYNLNVALGPTMLPIIGIYELCDSNSSAFLDPEAHFGLLTSDLRRKSAFLSVQRLCSRFREVASDHK